MAALLLRILTIFGAATLLGSVGVCVGILVAQVPRGPVDGQPLWPTESLQISLLHTIWMAVTATFAALLISLPATIGISIGRPRGRRIITAITVLPLVTMPSVYAYATLLITNSNFEMLRRATDAIGWNRPEFAPMHAGLVLAWWLWPIPALLLAAAYRHAGAPAYRLASLDASPVKAFLRGALPPMRESLLAAAAAVFILAAIDSTVPPFMAAARVWGVELMADAREASSTARPGAYLFFRAWPLVAVVMLIGIVVLQGAKRMADWGGTSSDADTGRDTPLARRAFYTAAALAFLAATLPIWIYAFSMFDGRYGFLESFSSAWTSGQRAIGSSVIVALVAAACTVAIAIALLDDPRWPSWTRMIRTFAVVLIVMVALFPPAVISTALIAFFSSAKISPSDRWNLYDNTPAAWVAAMICRYAFLPVLVAKFANRRIPDELPGQAATDGAGRWMSLLHARLPRLWMPILAAGLLVAGLSLNEVPASSQLQPAQWGGGSIAVWTDDQMHFGRHNRTTALALMMMTPGLAAVTMLMLSARRWRTSTRANANCTPDNPG